MNGPDVFLGVQLKRFAQLITEDGERSDVARLSETVVAKSRVRRRTKAGLIALCTVLVAAGAVAMVTLLDSDSMGGQEPAPAGERSDGSSTPDSDCGFQDSSALGQPDPGPFELMDIFEREELVSGGERYGSPEEATALAGYRLGAPTYLPSCIGVRTPEVWLSLEFDAEGAALRYGSQLVLTFGPWPEGKDPAESYALQASQYGVGTAEMIGDRPAFIVPQDAQAPGHPPINVIDITIDGSVAVTLYGLVPMEELRKIAESIPGP